MLCLAAPQVAGLFHSQAYQYAYTLHILDTITQIMLLPGHSLTFGGDRKENSCVLPLACARRRN
jgi:hypothetical protein